MALAILYHAGFLRWRGATPGKLLCGLRVRPRSVDGRLSSDVIATRLAAQFLPGWFALGAAVATGSFTVFMLGQLIAFGYSTADVLWATGARRQALHDRAAQTVVVTTR